MWQDWWFALSGVLYTVVLVPSCLDPKTEVPRASSLSTAIVMGISAFVYGTLEMYAAASMIALGAIPWLFLFIWRPTRDR